ncbi:divergent polysaccharide deacetylase family protein, partial [Enterobacter sp. BH2-YP2023]|uniref:divergent polysaccharide deacetylase family protein n=1 Tax=Enterobacter sp. BH2-YP2023 TaxID=3402818 RepID=UPI003D73C339
QAEQGKLNETLILRRQQFKEKNQHYADLKALCEREATIKDLENYRAQLEAGKPCPLCGSRDIKRKVFLDDSQNEADIRMQFNRAVQLARRNGSAIAIGHPHPST